MAEGKPGRPRKTDAEIEKEVVEKVEAIAEEKIDLKTCPKCSGESAKSYKDVHGNWRCSCPECNFWDSQVYNTEKEARIGFNAAGGPVRFE